MVLHGGRRQPAVDVACVPHEPIRSSTPGITVSEIASATVCTAFIAVADDDDDVEGGGRERDVRWAAAADLLVGSERCAAIWEMGSHRSLGAGI